MAMVPMIQTAHNPYTRIHFYENLILESQRKYLKAKKLRDK